MHLYLVLLNSVLCAEKTRPGRRQTIPAFAPNLPYFLRESRLPGPQDIQLHRPRWFVQRLQMQRVQIQQKGKTRNMYNNNNKNSVKSPENPEVDQIVHSDGVGCKLSIYS